MSLKHNHRIKDENKDRERTQKIKDILCHIASFVVVGISCLCSLAYFVSSYGESMAFWYLIANFWAVNHIISLDSKEYNKEIELLKMENNRLKILEQTNKELEAKLKEKDDN